jgi:hypothetical protein
VKIADATQKIPDNPSMAILSAVDGLGLHESPTMTQTVLSPKVVADKSALGGIVSAYPIAKKRIATGIANIWHAAIDFSSMDPTSSHQPPLLALPAHLFDCGHRAVVEA